MMQSLHPQGSQPQSSQSLGFCNSKYQFLSLMVPFPHMFGKRRINFSLPYESPPVSAFSRPVLLSQSQFHFCAPFALLLIAALDSWTTVLSESPFLCISISRGGLSQTIAPLPFILLVFHPPKCKLYRYTVVV